jgi:hypothetical protein
VRLPQAAIERDARCRAAAERATTPTAADRVTASLANPEYGNVERRKNTMSGPADSMYDVIVVGMGPIRQTVAERAGAAGLSVAAVERELVGGECSYWACIPSKAMLQPVVAVADARRVAGARQAVAGPVDAPAVFTRRDGYVTNWNDDGQANWLKSIGAELIRGHGLLDGPRRVTVETPGGQRVPLARQAGGGDVYRQPPSAARAGRPGPGAAVEQPGGNRIQHRARAAGRRRRRGRDGNG